MVKLTKEVALKRSPTLGRFLQSDPIGGKDDLNLTGDEDDLNLHAYVGNDPLDRTDPSRNVGELAATGCAISAEVVSAAG
jgi:hypothetical protein